MILTTLFKPGKACGMSANSKKSTVKSSANSLHNISSGFLMVHLLIIPLIFTRQLTDPVLPLRYLALCLLMLGFAAIIVVFQRPALFRWHFSFFRHPAWLAYLVYLFLSALSLFQGFNTAEAAVELVKLLLLAAIPAGIYLFIMGR